MRENTKQGEILRVPAYGFGEKNKTQTWDELLPALDGNVIRIKVASLERQHKSIVLQSENSP
jgi:hypothetical protein